MVDLPEGKGVETTVELEQSAVPDLTGSRVALAVVVVVALVVFVWGALVGFLVELVELVETPVRVQGVAAVAVQCLSPTAHSFL